MISLAQSLTLTGGNLTLTYRSPLAVMLFALSVASVMWFLHRRRVVADMMRP